MKFYKNLRCPNCHNPLGWIGNCPMCNHIANEFTVMDYHIGEIIEKLKDIEQRLRLIEIKEETEEF